MINFEIGKKYKTTNGTGRHWEFLKKIGDQGVFYCETDGSVQKFALGFPWIEVKDPIKRYVPVIRDRGTKEVKISSSTMTEKKYPETTRFEVLDWIEVTYQPE